MSKFLHIICVFLLSIGSTHSQNITDSLENELNIHLNKDTIRVNILNDLAHSYYRVDNTKALEYLAESETISDTLNFKKGKAKSTLIQGMVHASQSNHTQGIEYYEESLLLFEAVNHKKGIAQCYKEMGLFYYRKGDQAQAINYYKKSLEINEDLNDKEEVFIILNNIGWSYIQIGNYPEAITYYESALVFHEETNNKTLLSYCLSDLGIIYTYQGNYPLALEYFNKSLVVGKQNADSVSIGNTLGNMGPVYNHLENYRKAIECYSESIKYLEGINKEAIASNLNNLGLVYLDLVEYDSAHEYLEDAKTIYQEINNRSGEAVTLNNIGEVNSRLENHKIALQYFEKAKQINLDIDNQRSLCASYFGIAKSYFNQNLYDLALVNALKSKELSVKHELLDIQRDVQQLLSGLYKTNGDYQKAFESHQQFKLLNDSLFNKKNIEKIAQLESEYKYKQALDSASIRELKLAKTVQSTARDLEASQRNLLLGVIAFLVMSLLSAAIIFLLKLRNEKSKVQNIEVEQKLLRSQMTPHFIFNSLSVLQGMVLNKEDKKAVVYLSKFSKLLRITLENSRDKMVPLHQELEAATNYLELQNLEATQSYEYSIVVDDCINKSAIKIPPMLIQPFIENAIEHGFKNQKEHRKIDIELKYANENLSCTITDNGIGIDLQKKTQHNQRKKSLATTITSERLKILSKDYKSAGSVTIENREKYNAQGTIVTLMIPYQIDSVS